MTDSHLGNSNPAFQRARAVALEEWEHSQQENRGRRGPCELLTDWYEDLGEHI